jgi:hypothetical protein
MDCIDLRTRFGERYRVVVEESAGRGNRDPWYWIVPGKYGKIYPHGGEHLAVMVTSTRVANSMRLWPELEVTQDAEDAVCFKLHVDHFRKVASRVRGKTRRRLSAQHRRKLAEAGTSALEKYRSSTLKGTKSRQNQRSALEQGHLSSGSEIVQNRALFRTERKHGT